MSKLFQAAANETTTTNGMRAYKSTNNALLDLFFKIGTYRGQDMSKWFDAAYAQDRDKTLRILQWVRDIRGGAGERQRFRDLLKHFAKGKDVDEVISLLMKIPEIGRFDDLHIFEPGSKLEDAALMVHALAIHNQNGLAAKWAPRKGPIAYKLQKLLGMSPKSYRKTIVGLSNTVEQKMCAQEWDKIEYSHVPSVASKIYSRAFRRHDEQRYNDYLSSVQKGESKMNASAIFPHDIYNQAFVDSAQANAQWKSLPNYLEGVDERILVMSDVSGSMSGLPMSISVALGLYFSERLEGVFKDCVLTFSDSPSLVKLSSGASLRERINELRRINWGMSTNLAGAFEEILRLAKEYNLSQEDIPTKVLIISDMQFNSACGNSGNDSSMKMIRDRFSEAGFIAPNVIFWNVANFGIDNVPISFNESGVGLVSGASPVVIKNVLGGEVDPIKLMLKTIMIEKYKL